MLRVLEVLSRKQVKFGTPRKSFLGQLAASYISKSAYFYGQSAKLREGCQGNQTRAVKNEKSEKCLVSNT